MLLKTSFDTSLIKGYENIGNAFDLINFRNFSVYPSNLNLTFKLCVINMDPVITKNGRFQDPGIPVLSKGCGFANPTLYTEFQKLRLSLT